MGCKNKECQINLVFFLLRATSLVCNHGSVTYTAYLDFSKAFDRVSHGCLDDKMVSELGNTIAKRHPQLVEHFYPVSTH